MHNERELLAYMAPNRTTKERGEYLAPIVKSVLQGIEPSKCVNTVKLCDRYLMFTTGEEFPAARKACIATLLELAKGPLRNWRRRGEPTGRKYMGRIAFTQIWHDEKFCEHPVTGLDPAARKAPAVPKGRKIEPLVFDNYPYLDTLKAAFKNGTPNLAMALIHITPMILQGVSPQGPMAFSSLVDHLMPRDMNAALRGAVYDVLRALAANELLGCVTRTKFESPRGKITSHLVWHRAKNIEPATTE